MPDDPIDVEKLIADLRELASRAEALGDEQKKVMEILSEAIGRANAILHDQEPADEP